MLSLTLLFFAILLAAVTSVAGRVFCGYFCFQTVWTDVFTYIETKLEGSTPHQVKRFNSAEWTVDKLTKKLTKHSLWLLISMLTGISFAAWFTDAYQLWHDYFTLQAPLFAWVILGMFTAGTYILAGFMREQVCFWLCPYARLQSVMYDQNTILPSYDDERGEPRGKLKKGQSAEDKGSCVDCNLCVAVCPTGVDIREGQQHGCITCGLCIDACDTIMEKTNQPKGLIRYASFNQIHHKVETKAPYKRPRVMIYVLIMLSALSGIVYGFSHLSPTEFNVIHERQPLFVRLSDGSIQNKYTIKLLNKTKKTLDMMFEIEGVDGAILHGLDHLRVEPGKVVPVTAFVRVHADQFTKSLAPIVFKGQSSPDGALTVRYESMFMGPK
jgi:cytochrome c oxidase accessory protein FixG